MAGSASEKQAIYYGQELDYLRQAGAQFAKKYPKVASRLDLHEGASQDPHVERLIESFAYLTGRLRRELDDRTAQMASALLSNLYPHLIHMTPSMSIAQFKFDPTKGKLTDGYVLPRGSKLQASGEGDVACYFRSSYDVTLWPIGLSQVSVVNGKDYAGLESGQLLRLTLTGQGTPLSALNLRTLQFYLAGEPSTVKLMCDQLLSQNPKVYTSSDGGKTLRQVQGEGLTFSGLDDNEAVLPSSPKSQAGYRLVQEYFAFPQKFHFFNLNNLDLSDCDSEVEIFISLAVPLTTAQRDLLSVDNFLLGCTPIVNLFDRISEPVRLNHQTGEYRLIPDSRRERATEIYDIRKVSAGVDSSPGTKSYSPYFATTYASQRDHQTAFWIAKRQETIHAQMSGSDVLLSFVNVDFDPLSMEEETVFAHLTCTNRGLAEQIVPGTALQMEEGAPSVTITCLDRPTPQVEGPSEAGGLWMLINALSLNGLFMSDVEDPAAAFQETLLMLGGAVNDWAKQEVGGITELTFDKVVRRLRPEAWRGFAQGLQVNVTVDESVFAHHSALIFGNVLNAFFQMYVSANAFTQVSFKSTTREEEWHRWPLKTGSRAHL
jgi:type VI secretion system protein ImpG